MWEFYIPPLPVELPVLHWQSLLAETKHIPTWANTVTTLANTATTHYR